MTALSTTQLRQVWAPACVGPWATVELYGGAKVTVDPLIVPAVIALSGIFERHGYRATPPDTGAYNCRRITGGTGYSLHAYGIAIDVNWLDNPYGPRLVTDMPPAMIADVEALRTVSGHTVWRWGGRYRTNKDAMHFEVVCTPEQLATGIRSAAAPTLPPAGRPAPPTPEKEWDEMATEKEIRDIVAEEVLKGVIALSGDQVPELSAEHHVTSLKDVSAEIRAGVVAVGVNVIQAVARGQGVTVDPDEVARAVADELAERLKG